LFVSPAGQHASKAVNGHTGSRSSRHGGPDTVKIYNLTRPYIKDFLFIIERSKASVKFGLSTSGTGRPGIDAETGAFVPPYLRAVRISLGAFAAL